MFLAFQTVVSYFHQSSSSWNAKQNLWKAQALGIRYYLRSPLYFYFFCEKYNISHWMVLSMTDTRLNCVNIILHLLVAAGSPSAVIHFWVSNLWLPACQMEKCWSERFHPEAELLRSGKETHPWMLPPCPDDPIASRWVSYLGSFRAESRHKFN